jgi:hypothetical protein
MTKLSCKSTVNEQNERKPDKKIIVMGQKIIDLYQIFFCFVITFDS